MKLALLGDIGGSNARFALWRHEQLASVRVLATADFATPEQALSRYLSDLDLAPGSIGSVCQAVAGPVSGEHFRFTNNHWRLISQHMGAQLDLQLVTQYRASQVCQLSHALYVCLLGRQ